MNILTSKFLRGWKGNPLANWPGISVSAVLYYDILDSDPAGELIRILVEVIDAWLGFTVLRARPGIVILRWDNLPDFIISSILFSFWIKKSSWVLYISWEISLVWTSATGSLVSSASDKKTELLSWAWWSWSSSSLVWGVCGSNSHDRLSGS